MRISDWSSDVCSSDLGCFMLMHTGSTFQISQNGLVTTSAAQTSSQPLYALEGSVFVAGAVVQWMRDGLHAFKKRSEIEALAPSVNDSRTEERRVGKGVSRTVRYWVAADH